MRGMGARRMRCCLRASATRPRTQNYSRRSVKQHFFTSERPAVLNYRRPPALTIIMGPATHRSINPIEAQILYFAIKPDSAATLVFFKPARCPRTRCRNTDCLSKSIWSRALNQHFWLRALDQHRKSDPGHRDRERDLKSSCAGFFQRTISSE